MQQLSVPGGPNNKPIGITDIYTPEEIEAYSVKFHAGVDQVKTTDFAYFVQKGDDGLVKIGYTRNIKQRMQSLKTKHGKDCILRATRIGGRQREMAYHFQFAADCIEGEWFHPSEALLAEIERLNAEGGK